MQVSVWERDTAAAAAAAERAHAAAARVDSLTAGYNEASDVARINRRAGTDSVTVVAPETGAVLAAALRWARRSRGAYDPTVGPLDAVWAAYRAEGREPPAPALDSAAALVGWRLVAFDSARRTVRLPRRGMRLDLAPLARGQGLDGAAAALRQGGIDHGSIDLGGDILFFGSPPEGDLWGVGIQDPRNPGDVFAVVMLQDGAVASAGQYADLVGERTRSSRLVDPRTGRPARPIAAATAVTSSAREAEALAAALRILGPGEGCALTEAVAGAEALWVLDPGPPVGGRPPPLPGGGIVATPGLIGRLQLAIGGTGIPAPEPCAPH